MQGQVVCTRHSDIDVTHRNPSTPRGAAFQVFLLIACAWSRNRTRRIGTPMTISAFVRWAKGDDAEEILNWPAG